MLLVPFAAPVSAQQSSPPFFNLRIVASPSNGLITKSLGEVLFTFQISFEYDRTNPTTQQFTINVTADPISAKAPEGWEITYPTERQFNMKPAETHVLNVKAALSSDRPDKDRVDIEYKFTSQPFLTNPSPLPIPTGVPAQANQADSESAKVSVEKRLTVGETVTGLVRDYAWWFGGLALALFVLGVVVAKQRRPSGRIRIRCESDQQQVMPGRGASFPLRIANEGTQEDEVRLEVGGVPQGWTAILPIETFQLSGGASTQVWLTVKAPETAPAGTSANVDVTAVSERHGSSTTTVTVRADVVGGYAATEVVVDVPEPPPLESEYFAPPEESTEAEPEPPSEPRTARKRRKSR